MRKPRDIDAELKAIREQQRALKVQRTQQFGELVEATGADALPIEALAGALLAAVEAVKEPGTAERWTERGRALFRTGAARQGGREKGASAGRGAGSETEATAGAAAGEVGGGPAPAKDGSALL